MSKTTINNNEISQEELSALIDRVEHAIENELALTIDDMKMLLLAITTLSTVQQHIESKDLTLHRLRKLLGMVQNSEKRNTASPTDKTNNPKKKPRPKRKKTGKNSTKKKKPAVIYHPISQYNKGDVCLECQHGKLYKFEPGNLLRITGHSPYEAAQHVTERLRCNGCQKVYTAPLPEEVLRDGGPTQQYGYSARSLMAIHKFYSGIPYNHQGNLADILGFPISASTIYDQCELLANDSMPIFNLLKRLAAQSMNFLMDDTHNRILLQQPETRPNRNGKGERIRTGVYSSGLIAMTQEDREIVLFETSLGHAGEFIDSILKYRPEGLEAPLVMCDALSSNTPNIIEVKQSYCNAHCRRQFVDLEEKHPEAVAWILKTYAIAWSNEAKIQELGLDSMARLAYHQENSLPAMEQLKVWAQTKLESNTFEENGSLGKALKYLLRHYDKLIMFCKVPNALIDNNRMEETLKIVIRSRKTSHFFKSVIGAGIANVITSIIATCARAEVNLFDYLNALQSNKKEVRNDPNAWLPWNYESALEKT